jgi:DnaJ-class molecular chaperone
MSSKTCKKCNGSGTIPCPACNGKGESKNNEGVKGFSWEPCACCEGKGYISCPNCEGSGEE